MALAYGQEILRFSAISKYSFFVHTVNFIRIVLLMILDDLFLLFLYSFSGQNLMHVILQACLNMHPTKRWMQSYEKMRSGRI
jgi:hypothetical protein